MEKFINILTIALLIIAGFYFMTEIKQSGYDHGYDDGYQACVEEYNLYLPFE